jgi:hypothetical protein
MMHHAFLIAWIRYESARCGITEFDRIMLLLGFAADNIMEELGLAYLDTVGRAVYKMQNITKGVNET